jgi:hypothetical protein
MTYAYGLINYGYIVGVCTFGTPASRHLQQSACPSQPEKVIELNRLWVADAMPTNTESWFVSRCLKKLPAFIVVSYADLAQGHHGYIYRALSFDYAGWTDMERKTPRFDWVVVGTHSRHTNKNREGVRVRRQPKMKFWTVTGSQREKRALKRLCGWPSYDWRSVQPPALAVVEATL